MDAQYRLDLAAMPATGREARPKVKPRRRAEDAAAPELPLGLLPPGMAADADSALAEDAPTGAVETVGDVPDAGAAPHAPPERSDDGDNAVWGDDAAGAGEGHASTGAEGEPFGRWLLGQGGRSDWIGGLARAARIDPGFPKAGTPDDVRARLVSLGAEGDLYEQVDDAERCWLGEAA